jgi:hypothetical protein
MDDDMVRLPSAIVGALVELGGSFLAGYRGASNWMRHTPSISKYKMF